jgi:hypothetical protein
MPHCDNADLGYLACKCTEFPNNVTGVGRCRPSLAASVRRENRSNYELERLRSSLGCEMIAKVRLFLISQLLTSFNFVRPESNLYMFLYMFRSRKKPLSPTTNAAQLKTPYAPPSLRIGRGRPRGTDFSS